MKDEAEFFQQESQQLLAFEAVCDRILSKLRVGKQSQEYKRTKAAIDWFIAEGVRNKPETPTRGFLFCRDIDTDSLL